MSRGLTSANLAQAQAEHAEERYLVEFDFDTPVYVHSGVGTITYDGNDYVGVGELGAIDGVRESEALGPSPVTFSLDGTSDDLIAESLDAGNFKDAIRIYHGYSGDDGTLVDDPWLEWSGFYDHSKISVGGETPRIQIVAQHDLSTLDEKAGGKYSDEDQQSRFSGDKFFQFIADMENVRLTVGDKVVSGASGGGGGSNNTRYHHK